MNDCAKGGEPVTDDAIPYSPPMQDGRVGGECSAYYVPGRRAGKVTVHEAAKEARTQALREVLEVIKEERQEQAGFEGSDLEDSASDALAMLRRRVEEMLK